VQTADTGAKAAPMLAFRPHLPSSMYTHTKAPVACLAGLPARGVRAANGSTCSLVRRTPSSRLIIRARRTPVAYTENLLEGRNNQPNVRYRNAIMQNTRQMPQRGAEAAARFKKCGPHNVYVCMQLSNIVFLLN